MFTRAHPCKRAKAGYLPCKMPPAASLVTVTVSALSVSSETLNVAVCPDETYLYSGVALRPGETRVFHFNNQEGCDSTVTVVVSASPAASFDLAMTPSCSATGSGSLAVKNPGGGLPPYRYSLDGTFFQDEPVFDRLKPGSYTVWLEDSHACLFPQAVELPALLPLSLGLDDARLPCDGGGVRLEPLLGGRPGRPGHPVEHRGNGAGDHCPRTRPRVGGGAQRLRYVAPRHPGGLGGRRQGFFVRLPAPTCLLPRRTIRTIRIFARISRRIWISPTTVSKSTTAGATSCSARTDPAEGWAGPFRQQDMKPAVYVWQLWAEHGYCGGVRPVRKVGDVTIVR